MRAICWIDLAVPADGTGHEDAVHSNTSTTDSGRNDSTILVRGIRSRLRYSTADAQRGYVLATIQASDAATH